jgi:hypothetical protein
LYWLAPLPLLAAILFLARRASQFGRAAYWASKSLFLLKRRYGGADQNDPFPAPDYTGMTLADRYEVLQPLARSGFSVVYEAQDRRSGDRLAVKILLPRAEDRGWMRDQFAREVAALRSIEHPGVAPVLDSWVSPAGEPCLVMPFLQGPTLRAALRGGPLHAERVARICLAAGDSSFGGSRSRGCASGREAGEPHPASARHP